MPAHQQGRFWESHDKVFANQRELNIEAYRRYARELGLDMERFEADLLGLPIPAEAREFSAGA